MKDSAIRRVAAILTGAILLSWPAIYNRYPLLYPDSITYLASGRPVVRAIFLQKVSGYYGMRSLIYSLGIFPFHWNITPWPVVGLHSLLAAYTLWLVVRSILERGILTHYLLLVGLLGLLSSLSWYASLIMPDVLGPLLYLVIYLLVFAREKLSGPERFSVALIACWAAASHITHLALAAGICLLLAALWLLRCPQVQNRMKALGAVAVILLMSAAAQVTLHAYLYGKPSLNADAPPFLAARVIADGPGRWYLQGHCGQIHFALCENVDELPESSEDFLWNPEGIWARAVSEDDDRIRTEELHFAFAVLRAYPREEISIAAANFWQQVAAFGLWDLDRNNWVLEAFDTALPGGKSSYLVSWQFNDDLPLDFFSAVQFWAVIASLGIIGVAAVSPLLRRNASARLLGLSVVILPTLVANALLTGVFSNVEERYQCRVVWLLPCVASLVSLHWLERHSGASREGGGATWKSESQSGG